MSRRASQCLVVSRREETLGNLQGIAITSDGSLFITDSQKGKIWRVGLMGYCSQKPFVLLFLAALEKCLLDQRFRVPSGAGVGAAIRSYSQVETAAAVSR